MVNRIFSPYKFLIMKELIYHYTTLEYFHKIIESGRLKVSDFERRNRVKPAALWLIKNPIWENTASKCVRSEDTDEIVTLSFEQQHDLLGCIRFVLPFNKESLCSWAKYKYASNTPPQLHNSMTKYGFSLGANPNEWFASFRDIPLSEVIRVEVWNGSEWQHYDSGNAG